MKKLKQYWILVASLFAIVSVVSLIALPLFSSQSTQRFLYQTLTIKHLSDSICTSSPHRASHFLLLDFVSENIRHPRTGDNLSDCSLLQVLRQQYGPCDKQAQLLVELAAMQEIQGDIVFLQGQYPSSHHTVAELIIDGNPQMFDPYYHKHYPLSVSKLVSSVFKFESIESIDSISYGRHFQKHYPAHFFKPSPLETKAKLLKHLVLCYPKRLQNCYRQHWKYSFRNLH